jgi:hypothetical protein
VNNIVVIHFFGAINLTKCSQKYLFGIWDPKKPILHPGSRGQKGQRSHIKKNIFRKEVTVLTISKVCKFVSSYVGQY